MARVVITGGTGLVGKYLCKKLHKEGYEVAILSSRRRVKKDNKISSYYWDISNNVIDTEALNSCNYIIHLAGANIGAKKWTKQRKEQISESRVKSAELLFKNLNPQNHSLKAFISASAIGYYGARTSERVFKETDMASEDFLGNICNQWEQSADRFADLGARVVKIRTGIVLTEKGGALSKFSKPAKMGMGSALGSGKQYLPWIHIDDLCNIYLSAIENSNMEGAYNAVAPEHISNKEFSRKVARKFKRPFWLPNIPSIIIKIIFGEMSVMLLNGSMVSSEKLEKVGYKFSFPSIDTALQELYK